MTVGNLKYLVTFDKPISTRNPGGGVTGTWERQFELYAGIEYLRGSEPVIAQRLKGVQPVVIKVRVSRLTKQIRASWRARDRNGIIFNIKSTTPNLARSYIDLLCETGAGGG